MRRWSEKIVLIVMIGIGIFASALDLLFNLGLISADERISQAIPGITLFILATITIFLLLELDQLEQLDKMAKHLSSLDVDAVAKTLLKNRYAGIYQVHPNFNNSIFEELISAKDTHLIRILQSWIPNLDAFQDELYQAVCNGARVEILLLQPRSQIARLRGASVNRSVESEIRSNLRSLSALYDRLPTELKNNLKVKTYSALLSFSIYQVNNTYTVSFFPQGKLAINTLQLEIQGSDSDFGKLMESEFSALWQNDVSNPPLTLENNEWETDLITG